MGVKKTAFYRETEGQFTNYKPNLFKIECIDISNISNLNRFSCYRVIFDKP